jgi:nucleoside-diphosphate-sugar epimerase
VVGPTLITGGSGLLGGWVRRWWSPADGRLVVVDHHETNLLLPGEPTRLVDQVRPARVIHLAWSASGTPGYRRSDLNDAWLRTTLELVSAADDVSASMWATGTAVDGGDESSDSYTSAKRSLRSQLGERIETGTLGWFRPFYVFDEARGRPEVVAATLEAQRSGTPVRLRSSGAVHDFVHASDVGAAIVSAVRAGLKGVVDIGSGTARSVADLVTALGWTWQPEESAASAAPAGSSSTAECAALRATGWTPQRTEEFFTR